ncbi:hypothetical protein BUALT_Bualt12G0040100 [Buddleja alternifolia]|uniref:3'-5' exonuclease domain-containing protein n=1 Tax=Buddleja alternifolia TaxID=168488 RepID=A0AAV6WTC2_9LAMI|nr:hypothetical protein BUALT_Bualt12G0040100 [Buddleja alternifolia]
MISISPTKPHSKTTTFCSSVTPSPPPSQLTANPEVVTEWIILTESINRNVARVTVGLDVEWRPSHSPRRNPIAVLQICVCDRCLVYQIIHAPYIPDALRNFFFHKHYTFVGVGVKSDLDKLVEDYRIGRHAKAVELAKIAAKAYRMSELRNAGLKELATVVLGRDVEKSRGVTLSGWDACSLTWEQVKYACVDAFGSYEIGRVLNASYYG